MMFRCEPTGMGIRFVLPTCGEPATAAREEAVSWMIRPAAGAHARLKSGTALKELRGRAVVRRASDGPQRAGRICSREERDATDEYVVELRAPDDVFASIVKLVEAGTPPDLELEPDGAGRVWDNVLDPTITLRSWRAELQVTPDQEHQSTRPTSPLEAQLVLMQRSISSARAAAWATAIVALLLLVLRLR